MSEKHESEFCGEPATRKKKIDKKMLFHAFRFLNQTKKPPKEEVKKIKINP
jgi:hypothetical protein